MKIIIEECNRMKIQLPGLNLAKDLYELYLTQDGAGK